MRILIMVLSYNEGVFADFMKAQQGTWDADLRGDVDVVYYYGETGVKGWCAGEMQLPVSDHYEMMHWKFKLALDEINYHDYDLIFRTNSCSYIVKERLIEVAKTLPKTGCYAGYHNGSYISGAGIFFSPDVLDILISGLTPIPHGAEDVLIGQILSGRVEMIAENSRVDAGVYGIDAEKITPEAYHYRFKTSNDHADRSRDIRNMYMLNRMLK